MQKPCLPARLLFFCDGNAERARMAAGLLASRSGARYDIYCAGMDSPNASTWASSAMKEIGIDIPHYHAADLNEYMEMKFDHVITLCDQVDNSCLEFPRDGDVSHWQVADPAGIKGTDEQIMDVYRQTRDALAVRMGAWLASQAPEKSL